ncbi:SDR family NAD(P)-dependent oxidoreductase [[Mycobacterium] vasticus]|uniref:SDR family NAD(P)-dependent oxidoreductase n=1 Tax=[Mycobacterium] vasticus TaxID=2875777 RepID=A0ABU5YVD4_9MYCO|nr:SDR family NAD(P)-dependent oxidoreductase [Mycolicibacter sp. MYC017]MEB3067723.1 SDR family NAD(P)-dependent oxidoreductase [Mycolicibacter sp. MYC017]
MLSAHPSTLPDGRIPVVISAHARDLVQAEAAALIRYLQQRPAGVAAVAQTLRATRSIRRHRAVIRARDTAELIGGLDAIYRDADHPLVARSGHQEQARTAFVFPGQGNQWPGMGADLLGVAAYRAEADRCDAAFRRAGHASPLSYLCGTDDPDPVVVQAAQFTHAAALAATWRHFGVLPDLTVGHSLGEFAAAYTAGMVDLDSAAAAVIARAELTDDTPGRYGMAMIALGAEQATEFIAGVPGWLELSVVNGPESVVVSGEWAAVQQVLQRADRRAVFARELAVRYPAHTSVLEPLRERMLSRLPDAQFHHAPVEFIASAYGGPIPAGKAFRQYCFDNLRQQVRFDLATTAALERGVTMFVEMSAHPTLLVPLADTAAAAQVLGSTDRDHPAAEGIAANIAAAAIADPGYRWRDFAAAESIPALRHFPHAPMHTTRLWAGAESSAQPVVMAERWTAVEDPGQRPARVAVIDYSGQSAELAAQLSAALDAGPEPDAELLVLVAPPAGGGDVAAAAAAFTAHAAAQTAVTPGAQCRRVCLVTRGAEQLDDDPPPRLAPAALAALHRSTGFGYPDQTFAHLDLPADPTPADLAAAVTALTLPDTEVAVRAGRPAVRRLCAAPLTAAAPAIPETVVITGGTGAIGMAYADYCAEHGARDITLISRSGSGETTAAQLDKLRSRTGTRITVIRCDITDTASLAAAITEYHPAPAELLVHTASAEAVSSERITQDAVRDAFGAKVIGLDNLVRDWPRRPDAGVLVCSSVLALWGGSGHGLYAAANRMADALVGQLRANGVRANSIRWGLWRSVAVVSGGEKDRIARTGLTPMPPEAAITAGLTAQPDDPVILAADFDRLAVFFDSQGVPWPFEVPPVTAPTADGAGRPVGEVVAAELATVLGLERPDDVDEHRALVDLGLDSLLALDLRRRLGRATGRRVALGPLLAGITAAQLTAVLSQDSTTAAGTERTVFTHD